MPRILGRTALFGASALALASCSDGSGGAIVPGAPAPAPVSNFTISGTITGASSLRVDSDLNDPQTSPSSNNSLGAAQAINAPATVKGFVTLPGAGAGNFPNAGANDPSDFYRFTGVDGQFVHLRAADFTSAAPADVDLDLFLYDSGGALIAQSTNVGSGSEQVQLTADGDHTVEVRAVAGTSVYTLSISSELASATVFPAPAIARVSPTFVSVEATPERASESLAEAQSVLAAASFEAGSSLERGDMIRFEPASMAEQVGARRSADIASDDPKTPFLAERLEALTRVKEMNRAEGADVYRVMAEPRLHQSSDPFPDPFTQWNLPSIGWDEARTLIADAEAAGAIFPYEPLIAVIDSGFQTDHPEIVNSIIDQREFVPAFVDGDGYDAEAEEEAVPGDPGFFGDCHSFHGTHVASTATAPQNSEGIVGVTPEFQFIGVKIGYSVDPFCDVLPGDLPNAILYAAGLPNDSGALPPRAADVINMSLGSDSPDAAVEDAVNQARAAGVLIVASAGNAGGTPFGTLPSYPAAHPGVIAVGATDFARRPTFYTQAYSQVDIAAPGGDTTVDLNADGAADGVVAAVGIDEGTSFSNGYSGYQGTSMAAPHVAAAIALMRHIAPAMTPDQFDALLALGDLTVDIEATGHDNETGYGLLSLPKMVEAAFQIASGGGPAPTGAYLLATPNRLDFGATLGAIELTAEQVGLGNLSVERLYVLGADLPGGGSWLTVEAFGVAGSGFGDYTFRVNRSALADGAYVAEVRFELSTGATIVVPVTLVVDTASGGPGESAPVYFRLERRELNGSYTEVAQYDGLAGVGDTITTADLPVGVYRFVFGTDMDNDGSVCDVGELCGTYPAAPVNFNGDFELTGTLSGVSFAVADYAGSSLSSASAVETGEAPGYAVLAWRRRPAQ